MWLRGGDVRRKLHSILQLCGQVGTCGAAYRRGSQGGKFVGSRAEEPEFLAWVGVWGGDVAGGWTPDLEKQQQPALDMENGSQHL